jgi:hypothetical protein
MSEQEQYILMHVYWSGARLLKYSQPPGNKKYGILLLRRHDALTIQEPDYSFEANSPYEAKELGTEFAISRRRLK